MNENQKKILIIVGIIAIIYALVTIFFFHKQEDKLKNNTVSIILTPRIKLQYKDDFWTRLTPSSTDEETVYKLYNDNKYIGQYHMMYNKYISGFNIFQKKNDEKVNYYTYEPGEQILGIKNNVDIGVIDFKEKRIADYDIIKQILTNEEIAVDIDDLYKEEITIDYDNDGKKERIVMFSNAYNETKTDKAFSYIAILKNNKYNIIYSDVRSANEIYNICNPYMQAIVDLRKDKKYTLIFGCEYYSDIGTKSIIYGEKNKKYQTLLS